jgi:hypothetical protein
MRFLSNFPLSAHQLLGPLLVFPLALLPGFLFAQTPSPLELRVMQSRKFLKPLVEVMAGVKTFCEDLGSTGVFVTPAIVSEESVATHPGLKNSLGKSLPKEVRCIWTPKLSPNPGFLGLFSTPGKITNKYANLSVSVVRVEEDGVAVRMRIFNTENSQIADPGEYVRAYELIGETLFIQAIEIDPIEQH